MSLKDQSVDEELRKRNLLLPFTKAVVKVLREAGHSLQVIQITRRTKQAEELKKAMIKAFGAKPARRIALFYQLFEGELWDYQLSEGGTGGTVTLR